MSKYIIIDAEAIQKRIEECNKCLSFVNKEHDTPYQKEIDVLQSILSQSTPLIPILEDTFDSGENYGYDLGESNYIGCNRDTTIFDKQDYISNLKLDI